MNPSAEYLAGFFDGEGSVSIVHGNKNAVNDWRMQITLTQKASRAQILFWVKDQFGGCLELREFSKENPKRKDVFTWRASLRVAERFLRHIQPHSIIKRQQIDLALLMMDRRRPRARPFKKEEGAWDGPEFARRMRELNETSAKVN